MKYVKELDSIRGIGIIMVVMFHWLPVDSWYNTFPNRPFGVDVFFVLSGFLITQILLVARSGAEKAGIPRKYIFMDFYLRRMLRILPAYFLTVLLILIFHQTLGAGIKGETAPALSFTLNFYFFKNQYWGDLTTHLWTLSIEEQFYLLWPWIILLFPSRLLPVVIGVFLAAGIVSQLLITDMEFGYLPTNTCFDAFAIGAGIASIRESRRDLLKRTYQVIRVLGIISTVVLIAGAIFPDIIFLSPQRTLRSLVAAWAITFVLYKEHRGQLQNMPFFSNAILIFLGKLSYGMYLYHLFFPWMYPYINAPLFALMPPLPPAWLLAIAVVQNFVMLIFVSWLSYQYMERPIVRLARRINPDFRPNRSGMAPPIPLTGVNNVKIFVK